MASVPTGIRLSAPLLMEIDKRARQLSTTRSNMISRLLVKALGAGKAGRIGDARQNHETGARANTFGREMAPRIAKALRAVPTGAPGNEYRHNEHVVALKLARFRTPNVGVTYRKLQRVQRVYAALETAAGAYEVYEMPVTTFMRHMRPSRSASSMGKVALVSRAAFKEHGRRIAVVAVDAA